MRKYLKKMLGMLLAACLLLSLSACGGNAEREGGNDGDAFAEHSPGSNQDKPGDDKEADGSPVISQNEDGFYEIHSAGDFVAYAELLREDVLAETGGYLNKSAILMTDIDLSDALSSDSGLLPLGGFYPVEREGEVKMIASAFTGEFDGNGHTISGIHLNPEKQGYPVGLFCTLTSQMEQSGYIHDLTIADSSFAGTGYVGAFAGTITGGSIENCVTAESVKLTGAGGRDYAGGIAGYAEGGALIRCRNYGAVTAQNAGGILGAASGAAYLVQCDNHGSSRGREAAGIVARHSGSSHYDGLVIGCINYGDVIADNEGGNGTASGIVGENGSTIRYCVNAGRVDGGEGDNAFAIGQKDGSIYACGNIGTVSGNDLYIYRFGYSWDLGTFEGLVSESLSDVHGYYGKALMGKDIPFTPMEATSAGDGSLTAALQGLEPYTAWVQGDGFPVWDGTGGLEEYDWLRERLGLA